MLRSYKYPLKPTRAQEQTLLVWLGMTRELYNAALQERRDAWAKQRQSVSCFGQMHDLAEVREVRPEFDSVPVVVLRGALRRLDKAFKAFFRRCKTGEAPGYPRFRGRDRWDSILIDDLGGKVPIACGGKRVVVPMLGKVKFSQHRGIEGTPKAMRLKLDAGRWYVVFACVDVPAKPLPASQAEVGVDLGLHHFAATSDGEFFENPRPLAHARRRMERAQRRVSRRKRGSGRRRAAVRLLARHHAHVANTRREHHIAVARSLVARYGVIHVEALNLKGLAAGMFAKSMHDAALGNFLHWLDCKAEEAGRRVLEGDPAGTSETCPACGRVEHKELWQRVHRCPCGLVCDRDTAAARVILGRGTRPRGAAPLVKGRLRSAKGKSHGVRSKHNENTPVAILT